MNESRYESYQTNESITFNQKLIIKKCLEEYDKLSTEQKLKYVEFLLQHMFVLENMNKINFAHILDLQANKGKNPSNGEFSFREDMLNRLKF